MVVVWEWRVLYRFTQVAVLNISCRGKKKEREMVAKDKPEFQIYIMPYVFRFMYSFRHRHM